MPLDSPDETHAVILYDGACGFCHRAVRWVAARDRCGRFRFARLRSRAARRVLAHAEPGLDFDALPDSIAVVDEQGIHTASTACLRIVRGLGFPWSLLALAMIVPRPLRDTAYRFFARNRYRWFGDAASCPVPPADVGGRFLDGEEEGSRIDEQAKPDP